MTLFKNYVSDFDFTEYILFLGAVPDSFRIDSTKTIFQIDNVQERSITSITAGLKEECEKKEYIDTSRVTEEAVESFLRKVWFVIDDKAPEDYIREIIKRHPKIIPADNELIAIFNEIRNKQSEKKNSLVEGLVIDRVDDVLAYGRYLTTNEIRLLVLGRIINTDPLSKGAPVSFLEICSKYPPERVTELIEDCRRALCCALFNKAAAQGFWKMFDEIYSLILQYPTQNIDFIFDRITQAAKDGCPDFDVLSLKFFIAKVKEGILQ